MEDPDPDSYSYLNATLEYAGSYGPYILVLILLLLISGMMSGSEIAFFSLTKPEIDEYKEKNKRVWDLIKTPRKLLATILITNNLVNVGLVLVSSFILHKIAEANGWYEIYWLKNFIIPVFEVGLITFFLLFFGEITPKVYATQKRHIFLRAFARPLRFFRFLFYPLVWVLVNSTQIIDRKFAASMSESASSEDIKNAIDLTSEAESPEEEKEILKGIVDFGSTSVKSIMTARVEVKAVDIQMEFQDVINNLNTFGYSRIPVYEESLDTVKGILHIKDLLPLLKDPSLQPTWSSRLRDPYFVPESKKIDTLLDEFKKMRQHIAVVVDEFGGTAGIVTLEDIVEEIFGEINDEFDTDDLIYSRLSENAYVMEGRTPLQDLIKITGLPDDIFEEARGDNDSLAGLILEIHGKIPEKNEVITFNEFEFHIESVSKNRIKRVKFIIPENPGAIAS